MLVSGRGSLASAKPARLDEIPKTYGSGRICAVGGCPTILSSYNPSGVCCLHNLGWAVRERAPSHRHRALPEISRSCLNPQCGITFVTTTPSKRYCSDRCRMKAFGLRAAG